MPSSGTIERTLAGAVIGCIIGLLLLLIPDSRDLLWDISEFLITITHLDLSEHPALHALSPMILCGFIGAVIGFYLDVRSGEKLKRETKYVLLALSIIGLVSVPYLFTVAEKYQPSAGVRVESIDAIPEEYIEFGEEELLKYSFFREAIEKPGEIIEIDPGTNYLGFEHNWGLDPIFYKVGDNYHEVYWYIFGDGIGPHS